MKIELPQNPNIYLMLAGLLGIAFIFLFSLNYGGIHWGHYYLLVLFCFILLVVGWIGLKKKQDLEDKKTEKEIELIEAKRMKTENEALFGSG